MDINVLLIQIAYIIYLVCRCASLSKVVSVAKVVDKEAQRQTRWIKEAIWIRKTPTCINWNSGTYQLSHTWDQVISRSRAPSSCKQSRRDQDVRLTSKRCHQVTHFQLCKVRSFYVIVGWAVYSLRLKTTTPWFKHNIIAVRNMR